MSRWRFIARSRCWCLRRAVARGEILGAGDVAVQKRTIAGLASPFVARVEDFKGRPTRRPLPQGTAVTADAPHRRTPYS